MADKASKVRLGVLLSGEGTTLVNILDRIAETTLTAEVVMVVASRQCGGAQLSRQAGIETRVVPYKEMANVQAYSSRIVELLDLAGVDLVCQAGFLSLWELPKRYIGRVMNVHPALLPSFGGHGMYGKHVHQAVLAAGCKVSGCTVHFVTNEYDRGPIIVQKAIPVEEGDTPETLAKRVFRQECAAYPEAINLFAADRLKIEGNVVRILRAYP